MREQSPEGPGLAAQHSIQAPLEELGSSLLASGRGGQRQTGGGADSHSLSDGAGAAVIDGMPLGIDDAELRRPSATAQDAHPDHGCAGGNGGHQGGVESGAQPKATVQELIPGDRGTTGEGGEGCHAADRTEGCRWHAPVAGSVGDRRERYSADDADPGDDEVRPKAGAPAGQCGERLQGRPCGGSRLVVGGGDHACGNRLLSHVPGKKAPGEGAGDRPRGGRDAYLDGGVGRPSGDPAGSSGERHLPIVPQEPWLWGGCEAKGAGFVGGVCVIGGFR